MVEETEIEKDKIKIISNPYMEKKNIVYKKYDVSIGDWEEIKDSDSILLNKEYHEEFPCIVEKVLDKIYLTYGNKGEEIFLTFEGTQEEYEKLKSAIEKNEHKDSFKLDRLYSYLDSPSNIMSEIGNLLNDIKSLISEDFANNEETKEPYVEIRNINDFLQKSIDDKSKELQEVEEELKKKRANLEKKKAEAALDERRKNLIKKLQDMHEGIVDVTCSDYKKLLNERKEKIGSEIFKLEENKDSKFSKSYLETREKYYIDEITKKVEDLGLKPEKNEKEINEIASDNLLEEVKREFEKNLINVDEKNPNNVERVFGDYSVNILEHEMNEMKSKLKQDIEVLSDLDENCKQELLNVVSSFPMLQFNKPMDHNNVPINDIFNKKYLEKKSLLYRTYRISRFEKKKLNLNEVWMTFENEFNREKDNICESIINNNENNFRTWTNNLCQELKNTIVGHQLTQGIKEEESKKSKLKDNLAQLNECLDKIKGKIDWKKMRR